MKKIICDGDNLQEVDMKVESSKFKVSIDKIYISVWDNSLGLLTRNYDYSKGSRRHYIFTCIKGIESGTNGLHETPEQAIKRTLESGKPVYVFDNYNEFAVWLLKWSEGC